MDISEIRKQNLLILINDLVGGSQKNFALIVGTSPAYLSQIINGTIGRNGKPATVGTALARKIEKALHLPHGAMDQIQISAHEEDLETMQLFEHQYTWEDDPETGIPSAISKFEYKKKNLVPVISWDQVVLVTEDKMDISEDKVLSWLPKNPDFAKYTYALKVKGISMSPNFLPDDLIYINPNIKDFNFKTDDLVIVSCTGQAEATFKKLIVEGNESYLQSINPNWPEPITRLADDCKIIGKVVGMYREI
ncbi:MAG TPA: LexA family transcriptional repressor [Acinetobacter radioresistens]|uniref:LexA family transcriptional repressor n=1 Tax=Acinetobacter radioresistens TaxID=40216 RepID=A0A3D3G1D9_ACIRA|nr:LexA family transcriptional repressor [Acinetobacter radioresistens]